MFLRVLWIFDLGFFYVYIQGGDELSSYTKSGFSKSFGCCDKFKYCDNGKKTCWFVESDPETMESCSAWARNNLPVKAYRRVVAPVESVETIETVELVVPEELAKVDIVVPTTVTEKEQLTLF